MNCETCHEQIVDYLYGELDDDQRQRFEAALLACPSCARELAELQQVHALVDQAPTFALDDDRRDAVLAAARAAAVELAAKSAPDTAAALDAARNADVALAAKSHADDAVIAAASAEGADAVVLRPSIFRHPALHIAIAAIVTAGIASWLFLRDESTLDTLAVPANTAEMAALDTSEAEQAAGPEDARPEGARPEGAAPADVAEQAAVAEAPAPNPDTPPDDDAQVALLRAEAPEAPEAQRRRAAPDDAREAAPSEAETEAPTQIARASTPQAPAPMRSSASSASTPAATRTLGGASPGSGAGGAASVGSGARVMAARPSSTDDADSFAADERSDDTSAEIATERTTAEDHAPAAMARVSDSADAGASAPSALRAEALAAPTRDAAPTPSADAFGANDDELHPVTADEALGDAHQAWEASDYTDAYLRFAAIEQSFPQAFARDAEALFRAADSARALQRNAARDRWANAYLTRYPDGRHAARLRAWLAGSDE